MDKYIKNDPGFYGSQLLIATPNITESCFARAVIYMCVHNEHGAMGVIINHPINQINGHEMMKALMIEEIDENNPLPVHLGGPVEPSKGFILHSRDYISKNTLQNDTGLYLSSNREIFEKIAMGEGPEHSLLVLGYAGWSAGQLEKEVEQNSWFTVPYNTDLVFKEANENKWISACRSVGVDPYMLSEAAGHA